MEINVIMTIGFVEGKPLSRIVGMFTDSSMVEMKYESAKKRTPSNVLVVLCTPKRNELILDEDLIDNAEIVRKEYGLSEIEEELHSEIHVWILNNAPEEWHCTSLDEIPRDVFSEQQLKEVDKFNERVQTL